MKRAVILGIDPGTECTGWGVVAVEGKKALYIDMGTIYLKKGGEHFDRMRMLYFEIESLIKKYSPTHFAIEAQFFGQNVQSMLKLGRAQGVSIAAALAANLPVKEYQPKSVKMAITGRGGASKEQVASMVCAILKIERGDHSYDATDGLAIALSHYFSITHASAAFTRGGGGATVKKSRGGWSRFIKDNPDRVK